MLDVDTSSSTSTSSSALRARKSPFSISPTKRDFLFRRPDAIRTPGGHLLVSSTPQPHSLRMRGGNKKRRRDHGLNRGSVSFTKKIMTDDRNKFVRVITPLKKRQKREHTNSQDMTESQINKRDEREKLLPGSPSNL